jgi:hypothetical protein
VTVANSVKTYSHFLAKLSPNGGPDPATELQNILKQCRRDLNSASWFANFHPSRDFSRAGNSICVIFHHPDQSPRVEALVARVLSREQVGSPPEGAEVRDFYQTSSDRFKNWWPVGGKRANVVNCDVVLTEFESLDAIPGHRRGSTNNARETFVAQCSFAGWIFDASFRPLEWLQQLPGSRP